MKNFYILAIFSCFFLTNLVFAAATPGADVCSGAVTITPGATCSWTATNSGASSVNQLGTAGYPTPGCAGSTYNEVWYKFVAPATGSVIIDTDVNGITDSGMGLYSGSCGAMTLLECDDDDSPQGMMSSITYNGLTVGATYYVAVWQYGGGTGTFKICIQTYTPPAAPANDNCAGATAFPVIATTGACSNLLNQVTNAGATNSNVTPSGACTSNSGTPDDDVWFKFVAPAANLLFNATWDSGETDMYYQVFSGACGASMTSILCTDNNTGGSLSGLATGSTYYIRMYTYYNAVFTQQDLCLQTPPPPPANDECTGAYSATVNAYGSCASTTAGTVQAALPSVVPMGSCFGTADDDVWFTFTATSGAQNISLTGITGSTSDMYFSVYSGACATLGSPILCSDPETGSVSGLTIGQSYKIRVYSYTSLSGQTSNFNVCISGPPACPANLGAGNVNVASLPYAGVAQTTVGAGNDITTSNAVSCGSTSYFYDLDKVYIFTPTASGNTTITLNSTQSYTGITLYEGCPFSGTCIAYSQTSATGAKSICANVVSGTTYYLVVDSYLTTGGSITSFTLNISAPTAGAANDLPCGATTIFTGTSVTDDNNCTGGSGEPAKPTCWTSGTINSVWFKFQATAATMYAQTTLSSIAGTQVAVYSGACGALTFIACNDDAGTTGCSAATSNNSIVYLTGLGIGSWYWIRVDGDYEDIGTFNLVVNNGSSTSSNPLVGQDCSNPVPLCTNTTSVPNPSYSGTGNICDFTGASDCTSGEKNSVWYTFDAGTTGSLNFSIKPNDATNASSGAETDYDWVLWKQTNSNGSPNTSCLTLDDAPPVSCNFGFVGITGISPGGNTPAPFTGANDSYFEPTVAVTAGETYILVVQNFETSSSGFAIDFSTSTAGVIDPTPNTIYWNGATNTTFGNVANYAGCATAPACGINVVINSGGFSPQIATTASCKDLTINAGATLTLAAGATLTVCGSFNNYGTIVCPVNSTVVFVDGTFTTQYVNGNVTGGNKFGNVTVTKASGSVILNTSIEIGGNFLTSNGTSVFNSNDKYVYLGGNFTNNNGNTTYTNTGTLGTLEFNGTGLQNYNQGSSQLDLNFVNVNNTAAAASGVTLLTDMFIKATTGTLTLTAGTITTGGALNTVGVATITGNRVHVVNTAATAVSIGSATSYVNGTLRRYHSTGAAGAFNWPVGKSGIGYQRALTNFTAISNAAYVDCRFEPWPTPCTTGYTEGTNIYSHPSMNHGMWTFLPQNTAHTYSYDCTLYPLGATNIMGSVWTIIKRTHGTTIANDASWLLNGTYGTSSSTVVPRTGLSNFSFLGVDQGLVSTPIELLYFTGKVDGAKNILEWETTAERDNDYFIIEKSTNGIEFVEFAKVDGAGNSTTNIYYSLVDQNPGNGTNYYRLKQADFNGTVTEHNTIALTNKLDDYFMSSFYPNPTSEISYFDFYSLTKGDLVVNIIDNSGRLVSTKTVKVIAGNMKIELDSKQLNKGVYNIEVSLDKEKFKKVEKLVKN